MGATGGDAEVASGATDGAGTGNAEGTAKGSGTGAIAVGATCIGASLRIDSFKIVGFEGPILQYWVWEIVVMSSWSSPKLIDTIPTPLSVVNNRLACAF